MTIIPYKQIRLKTKLDQRRLFEIVNQKDDLDIKGTPTSPCFTIRAIQKNYRDDFEPIIRGYYEHSNEGSTLILNFRLPLSIIIIYSVVFFFFFVKMYEELAKSNLSMVLFIRSFSPILIAYLVIIILFNIGEKKVRESLIYTLKAEEPD